VAFGMYYFRIFAEELTKTIKRTEERKPVNAEVDIGSRCFLSECVTVTAML
jgi:hypothetical protein